jgi:uncharacterized membrane protein HdeD (DUF308 family)
MLSKYINGKSVTEAFGFGLFFSLVWFSLPAYSQSSPIIPNVSTLSPQTILASIQNAIPNLMRLATAFAYVIGIVMVIMGVIQLKHAGEMRTQMSHEHHLTKPLLMLTMGTLLIYLPSSVQVGLSTFWTEPNPYGYAVMQSNQWQQAINVCFAVVQFIGVVAFIRGLVILSHAGGHHQNTFSKGIMHIIGGILCINIYQVIQVIYATVGMQ